MKSITIISWPKQHLPVNWNGVAPEELQGQTEDLEIKAALCLFALAQSFKLPQMLMGQIAQNRCYKLVADY